MAIVIFGISQRTVTGRVLDESSSFPLHGAIVMTKGGVGIKQTDVNGIFRMNIDDTIKTLVVSYIGFVEKEVSITESGWFDIRLEKSDFVNESNVSARNRMCKNVESLSPAHTNHGVKLKEKSKRLAALPVFNCMNIASWKLFK
jgi:hypothetical protein